MKRICAWCGKHLGDTPDHPDLVTHGICVPCVESLQCGNRESIESFLNSLQAPVMVIDSSSRVLSLNRAARVALGHEDCFESGQLPGEVLRCSNAYKPEGCGHTQDCQACVIRNSVLATFANGKPLDRRPTRHEIVDLAQARAVRYLISTRRANGFVLLRIDEVTESSPDGVGSASKSSG
jgi:hypothetical protein